MIPDNDFNLTDEFKCSKVEFDLLTKTALEFVKIAKKTVSDYLQQQVNEKQEEDKSLLKSIG